MPESRPVSEPIQKVIDVLQSWYQRKWGGITHFVEPSLDGSRPLFKKDDVNDMIRIIDKEFELELHYNKDYWRDCFGITEPPRFSELDGKARLAFVQDLWAILQNVTLPSVLDVDIVERWRETHYDLVRQTEATSGVPRVWGTPL